MRRKPQDVEYLNEIRALLGMPPVVLKKRRCLKCNMMFESYGSHHRKCDSCKKNERPRKGSNDEQD